MRIHVGWLVIVTSLSAVALTLAAREIRAANNRVASYQETMTLAGDALEDSSALLREATDGWEATIAEENALSASLQVCADGWTETLQDDADWLTAAKAAAYAYYEDGRPSDDVLFCLLGRADPFTDCLTMLEQAQ